MWKKHKNPQIEELTKTWKLRAIPLSNIDYVIREDGTKGCIWCGDPLKSNHHAARYCKGNCDDAAFAWSSPQKEPNLFALLVRQDWKCNTCSYDYKEFIEQKIINKSYGAHTKNDLIQYNYYIVKSLKNKIDRSLCPEVDHIIPISKGGSALDTSNHQAICYTCHKTKSKKDNSGPRPKMNSPENARLRKLIRPYNLLLQRQQEWYSSHTVDWSVKVKKLHSYHDFWETVSREELELFLEVNILKRQIKNLVQTSDDWQTEYVKLALAKLKK